MPSRPGSVVTKAPQRRVGGTARDKGEAVTAPYAQRKPVPGPLVASRVVVLVAVCGDGALAIRPREGPFPGWSLVLFATHPGALANRRPAVTPERDPRAAAARPNEEKAVRALRRAGMYPLLRGFTPGSADFNAAFAAPPRPFRVPTRSHAR